MSLKASKSKLHPDTIRAIMRGHPLVTLDRFSAKFDPTSTLIYGTDDRDNFVATLLNDPTHPQIKARLLSTNEVLIADLPALLTKRIEDAILKREPPFTKWNRENLYLVFAEADALPGIFVLKLKNHILIQLYAEGLYPFIPLILSTIKKLVSDSKLFVVQMRNKGRQNQYHFFDGDTLKERPATDSTFTLNEFGREFEICVGAHYDHGIYTDMSAIRASLFPLIEKSESVLNLFAYTGAYSIHSLALGVKKVVSVDLSNKYLDWLGRNMDLNPSLLKERHTSVTGDVLKTLHDLNRKEESFSLIISDPPSSSSDGKERSSALKDYETTIPLMLSLLKEKGHLVLFLNTHNINAAKFEAKIRQIIGNSATIAKKLRLLGDCPTLPNYPEGDYIKGLVVRKNC